MATYKWSFANVGGVTRVRIQSAEDIRHLGELDKKMWTVLSCPVNGLEISSDSLSLMDLDGDNKLRVDEVVATANWLCASLKNAETLFEQSDSIAVDNIADEAIKAIAEKLQADGKVSLAAVQAAAEEEKKKHSRFCTEIMPLKNFWPAEEYHQNYLEKNPNGYCHIASEEYELVRKLNLEDEL